jgi:hypothetical protein
MAGPPDRNGDLLALSVARLTARYGHLADADAIRTILHETYEALLADATVTTFIPLLAERSVATRLARAGKGDPLGHAPIPAT